MMAVVGMLNLLTTPLFTYKSMSRFFHAFNGWRLGWYALSALGVSSSWAAAPYHLSWDVHASAHSPAMPIHELINDAHAPLDAGDYAFVQGRTSLDYQIADSFLGYGLSTRYDYGFEFNHGASQVFWHYKNDVNPAPNQHHTLSIHASHTHRYGANIFAKLTPHPNWTLTPRLHLYKGARLIEGSITGELTTSSNTNTPRRHQAIWTANADVNYYYDTPALKEQHMGWNPNAPEGYGYGLDIKLAGQLSPKTTLTVQGLDVIGHLYWQNVPNTNYHLDYAQDSRYVYNVQGQLDDTATLTQRLPWRIESHLHHQVTPRYHATLTSQFNTYTHLHQLGVGTTYTLGNTPVNTTLLVEPQTQSVGVLMTTPNLSVKWLTDTLNTNHAKRGDILLGAHYAW